jgi:hypothetical protein
MRIARQIGLLLVAVCALSAVAVSSASAAQPLFLFHGTGGKLLGSGSGLQTLVVGEATIECTTVSAEGAITALRALNILITARYTNCKSTAFGAAPVTIHPAQFLIDANGLVKLENTVRVLINLGEEPLCVITLPAATNQGLNSVKIENTPANKGILILSNVTKISAFGTGGGATKLCEFPERHDATNTGSLHIVADGGLLKWDLNS